MKLRDQLDEEKIGDCLTVKTFTEQQLKRAKQMHEDGYSWDVIGKLLGATGSGIRNAVKRWQAKK